MGACDNLVTMWAQRCAECKVGYGLYMVLGCHRSGFERLDSMCNCAGGRAVGSVMRHACGAVTAAETSAGTCESYNNVHAVRLSLIHINSTVYIILFM